jgi:hypothetical protein
MWEQNDTDSFYFNDAASNPEAPREVLSLRHAGIKEWWRLVSANQRNLPGGGMVGTFGGEARYVGWPTAFDLINRKVPYPNPLLNGPGYQR